MPWSSSASSYQNCFLLWVVFGTRSFFCNRFFYCLSLIGWLGVFDPPKHTWNVLAVPPPECPDNFFAKNRWKGKFMSEHNRYIQVIYTCCSENPIIFKLDQRKMVWREMKTPRWYDTFCRFIVISFEKWPPWNDEKQRYFVIVFFLIYFWYKYIKII